MTNEAAFIELLHTLMQRQRETNAEPETETQAEPTLASAFAQGEINNTFIYTYVRYECVCNSFSPDFLVFFGNCHNAPLVKAVVK